MTERRTRRTDTKEFKNQIVKLHDTGKSRAAIIQEYDLSPSSFDTWLKQSRTSGSFSEKDNRAPEENELNQVIQIIFTKSRNNYGTRKIKVELNKQGYFLSKRRIGRIMNELGLVSNYTVANLNRLSQK